MNESRVADYPDFRRRGAGIINTNVDEWGRANARRKNAARLDKMEADIGNLNRKIDLLVSLVMNNNGLHQ